MLVLLVSIILAFGCVIVYWLKSRPVFIQDRYAKAYLQDYEKTYAHMERKLAEQEERVSKDLTTRYTTCPVFTKQECGLLIYEAEKYAAKHGWTRKRHENYPTTDLPLSHFKLGYSMVMSRIYALVIPRIAAVFQFEKEAIDVEDLFLIRYTEGKQNGLVEHKDGSLFSFVIPLNDDFEGGGTRLNGRVHSSPIGEALIFCGQQDHSGVPISRGTRYVLAGFLYSFD